MGVLTAVDTAGRQGRTTLIGTAAVDGDRRCTGFRKTDPPSCRSIVLDPTASGTGRLARTSNYRLLHTHLFVNLIILDT